MHSQDSAADVVMVRLPEFRVRQAREVGGEIERVVVTRAGPGVVPPVRGARPVPRPAPDAGARPGRV